MAAEKSSKWWLVYGVVLVVGGLYAIFYTSWGARAYEAVCYLLLIYGTGAAMYTLVRPLVLRLRSKRAVAPERTASEIEVQPVVKTPLFHDDPSRLAKSGIGMPQVMNFGVTKTVVMIVFFTLAGCLVHYLNAVPSRGDTLLGIGFVSAIAFYLWLLVRFAKSVYRWLKRHAAQHQTSSVTETPGR